MSHHAPRPLTDADKAVLGDRTDRPWLLLTAGGGVAIVLALLFSFFAGGVERFAFAYLVGFAFTMAIFLGNLFFVIITTLFRAGWCAAIRRVAETYAANILTLVVLFVPVLVSVFTPGALYPWTTAGVHEVGHDMLNHGEKPSTVPVPHSDGDTETHAAGGLLSLVADELTPRGASEHTPYAAPAQAETHAAGDAEGDAKGDSPLFSEQKRVQSPDGDQHSEAHVDDHGASHAKGHDGHAAHGDGHAAEGGHGEHADGHHDAHHGPYTHTAEHWPDHDHAVPYFVAKRGAWFTTPFYVLRWVIYFALWGLIGTFYHRMSVRQDKTADVALTNRREWWAPLSVFAFALTVTVASFDLVMSVDPVWYSTMFGVYYFAGAFTAGISTIILTLMVGQRFGYFPAVTTEHFHDLGKLLFAFVFFWGYVGFSQFMLIWYASLPETTYWWDIRGVTTFSGSPAYGNGWSVVAWLLLFGHLLVPFAFLLSKHVKRNRTALMVAAIWMLFMCWTDLFWVTLPALVSPDFLIPIPEVLCAAGCVAIFIAGALRIAARHSLVAHNDPRMHESLGLDTSAWAPIHH